MADPYWRYGPFGGPPGNIPMASFPGYMPSDPMATFPGYTPSEPMATFPGYMSTDISSFSSHHLWSSSDPRGATDYLQKDTLPLRPGPYGFDDIASIGSHPPPGLGGLTAGASMKGYPSSTDDPTLISQRRDAVLGINPGIPDLLNERPNSPRMADGLSSDDSNVLFVDGLPNDCTRREIAHLFRPFIGFKEIRVVHKEPRRSGDKAVVLCFVEFNDSKCARTAMEALQGYKFDDKKPAAPVLKIQFAHFPFRHPSNPDDQRRGGSLT